MKKISIFIFCIAVCLTVHVHNYNEKEAISVLYYARIAQCGKDKIDSWTCGAPCNYYKNMKDVKTIINVPRKIQSYTGKMIKT